MGRHKQKRTSREHYVARSYQENWAVCDEMVYAFNKVDRRSHGLMSVGNIACERDFNEFNETLQPSHPKYKQIFERRFGQIEGAAASLVRSVKALVEFSACNTAVIDRELRNEFCDLIAIQYLRTRAARETAGKILERLGAVIEERARHNGHEVDRRIRFGLSSIKKQHLMSIPRQALKVSDLLSDMVICLLKAPGNICFWTSDTPVVKQSQEAARESLVPAGFMYPLTPTICVQILEPTQRSNIRQVNNCIRQATSSEIHDLNELQTLQSLRWIISNSDNFERAIAALKSGAEDSSFEITDEMVRDFFDELDYIDADTVKELARHFSP